MILTADKGEINLLPYRNPFVPLVLNISFPGIIVKKQIFINTSERQYAFNHMLHLSLCLNFDYFLILDVNKNDLWDQASNS